MKESVSKKMCLGDGGAQVLMVGGNKTSNEHLSLSSPLFLASSPPLPGCAASRWRSWLFWRSWTGNSTLWSSLSRFRYNKARVCVPLCVSFFCLLCASTQALHTQHRGNWELLPGWQLVQREQWSERGGSWNDACWDMSRGLVQRH